MPVNPHETWYGRQPGEFPRREVIIQDALIIRRLLEQEKLWPPRLFFLPHPPFTVPENMREIGKYGEYEFDNFFAPPDSEGKVFAFNYAGSVPTICLPPDVDKHMPRVLKELIREERALGVDPLTIIASGVKAVGGRVVYGYKKEERPSFGAIETISAHCQMYLYQASSPQLLIDSLDDVGDKAYLSDPIKIGYTRFISSRKNGPTERAIAVGMLRSYPWLSYMDEMASYLQHEIDANAIKRIIDAFGTVETPAVLYGEGVNFVIDQLRVLQGVFKVGKEKPLDIAAIGLITELGKEDQEFANYLSETGKSLEDVIADIARTTRDRLLHRGFVLTMKKGQYQDQTNYSYRGRGTTIAQDEEEAGLRNSHHFRKP